MRTWGTLGALALVLLAARPAQAQIVSQPVPTEAVDQNKSQWNQKFPEPVNSIELNQPFDGDISLVPIIQNSTSDNGKSNTGFRALSVPEPGALALTGLVLAWTIGSFRKSRSAPAE